MTKKLLKAGTALAAGVSSLYWGVLPAMAVVDLCQQQGGVKIPGCTGGVSVDVIIGSVVNLLLFVAFIVALVFLIIGGIKWMMSGGDKEGSGKAKETVTSALIGLAVVLGAWVLVNIVIQFFTGGSLQNLTFQNLKVN